MTGLVAQVCSCVKLLAHDVLVTYCRALWGVDPRNSLKRHYVSMTLISVVGPLPVLFFSFTDRQFIAGIFVLADVGTTVCAFSLCRVWCVLFLLRKCCTLASGANLEESLGRQYV